MAPYCGGRYRVQDRVERIIDERNGQMLEIPSDCLILNGVVCSGEHSRGRWLCPRADLSVLARGLAYAGWRSRGRGTVTKPARVGGRRLGPRSRSRPEAVGHRADCGADVTVAIPTRNRSGLLRNAIESVLGQTYGRFAVLVVRQRVGRRHRRRRRPRFGDPRIVHRPIDEPISRQANFNRAFELAETEFVLLLSDDDWLHPDHLSLHGRGDEAVALRRDSPQRLHDR